MLLLVTLWITLLATRLGRMITDRGGDARRVFGGVLGRGLVVSALVAQAALLPSALGWVVFTEGRFHGDPLSNHWPLSLVLAVLFFVAATLASVALAGTAGLAVSLAASAAAVLAHRFRWGRWTRSGAVAGFSAVPVAVFLLVPGGTGDGQEAVAIAGLCVAAAAVIGLAAVGWQVRVSARRGPATRRS